VNWFHEPGFAVGGRAPELMAPFPKAAFRISTPEPLKFRTQKHERLFRRRRQRRRAAMNGTETQTIKKEDVADVSTALAEKKTGALAVVKPVEGLEAWTARDQMIPDLKIGQGNSQVKENVAGKLYNSLDPSEAVDKRRLVALTFRHGQVLFPKKADGTPDYDAPIACRSDDGYVPAKDIENPIAPACHDANGDALCVNAKWGGESKKPACSATLNLLVVDAETRMPYRVSFKGADVKTVKKLLSGLNLRAKSRALPLRAFEFSMSTGKEQGKDGSWYYVAIFTDLKEVADVKSDPYKADFDSWVPKNAAQEVAEAQKKAAEEKAKSDVSGATGSVVDAANKVAAEEKTKTDAGKKPKTEKSGKGRELDFDS
jgi:hypothetical protein